MKKYSLFIDESGNPNPKDQKSRFYILCGCAIEDGKREELKDYADQIKFKYWGRTDIVFHSSEIAKNMGEFSIFRNNPELKKEFEKDLIKFLNKAPITIFPVIVDKQIANKRNWNNVKIIQKTANHVISNYLRLLLTKPSAKGKIIIEFSAVEKDRYYLSSFTYFTSPGCRDLNGMDYKLVQKKLTSLSFVTKHNHDIEEQITDLLAYAAKCKYCELNGIPIKTEYYEKALMKVFDNKLFKKPKSAKLFKMEFFNKIDSFKVLPEIKK